MSSSRRLLPALMLVSILLLPTAGILAADSYDEGRLMPSWYAEGDVEFRETEEIDYLWVKDGVELKGKTFHFKEWPEPDFIGPKADERDDKDRRLARQMASDMHNSLAEIWNGEFSGSLSSSTEEGDILVEGRIVDCSTGSRAAKMMVGFGAGAGSTVIDVRFTDKESGEVVAGFHHRVVSGTSWSTTGSKFYKWVKKAGKELSSKGFQKAYEKGKRQRD